MLQGQGSLVNKLLCCYVNLRLLNRYSTEKGLADPSALTQTDDEMEDFLGQAVVLEADEEEAANNQTETEQRTAAV